MPDEGMKLRIGLIGDSSDLVRELNRLEKKGLTFGISSKSLNDMKKLQTDLDKRLEESRRKGLLAGLSQADIRKIDKIGVTLTQGLKTHLQEGAKIQEKMVSAARVLKRIEEERNKEGLEAQRIEALDKRKAIMEEAMSRLKSQDKLHAERLEQIRAEAAERAETELAALDRVSDRRMDFLEQEKKLEKAGVAETVKREYRRGDEATPIQGFRGVPGRLGWSHGGRWRHDGQEGRDG